MKIFLLFLGSLAVLSRINAGCVQEIQEARPHDISNICTNEINWALLPHPHDCHKFFVCANRVPEEFTCERNYYFDTQAKRCVRGSCSGAKACQNWVRAVANDCSAFEICENGSYARHGCTEDHYFNAELGMCRRVERTPQHMCSCLLPQFALVENPRNCESYYVCLEGRAVQRRCARGSYFDRRLSACVADMSGVCVTAPTMSPPESAMLDTCQRLGASAAAGEVVFVPDSHDCGKFYMCVNGRVVAKQCPLGFYYDREAKYCEYDSRGVCEAMREEAEKKLEQQEKEAEAKKELGSNEIQHNEAGALETNPMHLSLSYTHVKVEADKEPRPAKELPHSHAESSVEVVHTADLFVPPSPPIQLSLPPAKVAAFQSETANSNGQKGNEVETAKETVEANGNTNLKLPAIANVHAQLKVPGNSAYDKLASKFISF